MLHLSLLKVGSTTNKKKNVQGGKIVLTKKGWATVVSKTCFTGNMFYKRILIENTANQGVVLIGITSENKDAGYKNMGDSKNAIGFNGYNGCIRNGGRLIPFQEKGCYKTKDIVSMLVDLTPNKLHKGCIYYWINDKYLGVGAVGLNSHSKNWYLCFSLAQVGDTITILPSSKIPKLPDSIDYEKAVLNLSNKK
eukprot:TRINITY_DN14351_c0_g1_i2.p1 TRINITY_DN14351_c0_g1~~TRINITY_DN14351_c0_g1_i2.p1  ORF type:complete len:194 (+),score=33.98 TRINITY_DN14351_c0_g1_i2:225-806(+)